MTDWPGMGLNRAILRRALNEEPTDAEKELEEYIENYPFRAICGMCCILGLPLLLIWLVAELFA